MEIVYYVDIRIKYDLLICYEIINGEVSLHCYLLDLSGFSQTRVHKQKVYNQSSVSLVTGRPICYVIVSSFFHHHLFVQQNGNIQLNKTREY